MSAAPILVILRDGETIRTQPVEGEISIGRGDGNVIRLEDRAISRQHAVVRAVRDGVQIEKRSDFGSVSVNGAECTSAVARLGDIISIGPYLVRLEASKSPAAAVPAPAPAPEPVATPSVAEEVPALLMDSPEPIAGDPAAQTVLLPEPDAAILASPIDPSSEGSLSLLMPDPGAAPSPLSLESDAPQTLTAEPMVEAVPSDPEAAEEELDLSKIFDSEPVVESQTRPIEVDLDDPGTRATPTSEEAKTRVLASPLDAKLVLISGEANVTELSIAQGRVTIGRGKDCDVVLNDKKSSRMNSEIVKEGSRYRVRDLDSSNGTYVNGKAVKDKVLGNDDRLRIGESEFRFVAVNPDFDKQSEDFMSLKPEETPLASPLLPQADESPASHPASPVAPLAGVAIPSAFSPPPALGLPPLGPGIPQAVERKGIFKIYDKYIRNFKTLKPAQKLLVVLVGVLFVMWFLEEEPEDLSAPKTVQQQANPQKKGKPGVMTLENLSPEQRKFVETQYTLAFDLYTKKEYDKALYEVTKVFSVLPDHDRAKELERYIREAKRILDAKEEEKRKQEEEARVKARIESLKQEIEGLMKAGKYEEARERFAEILEIDPEDAQVAEWRAQIDAFFEEQARVAQEKRVQDEINKAARDVFAEAEALQKADKFHEAIKVYRRVSEMGSSDKSLLRKADARAQSCLDEIRDRREPVLARAKEAEQNGDLVAAFRAYEEATKIDPPHAEGYAGMDRIRAILNDQSKALYTEAVIAESYSDFKTAYAKYQEILKVAPQGSLYHERAQRKIANYRHFKPEEEGMEQE